jgi:integrase/recombinase XerD
MVDLALTETVQAVAFWKMSTLPKTPTLSQVKALLGICDRSTPVGRRDYAVITVLHRLALRSGEVCALRLDDVNRANGTLTVHGKAIE